jgi:hypothetical protein
MRTATALLATSLSLGCGGDDGPGGGGNLSLDELGDTLGDITCTKIFECCNEAEIMDMFGGLNPPITTFEECVEFYDGFVTALLLGPAADAVDRGTLIYDGELAADCFAAFEAASCEEVDGFNSGGAAVPECEDIFEGQLADGETCVTDLECVSGTCDGDSLNGDPGVCATPPGEGEPCETFDCADGFYCDDSGGEGVCAPAQADGAGCSFDDDCQSDNCDQGTCMPRAPECTGA